MSNYKSVLIIFTFLGLLLLRTPSTARAISLKDILGTFSTPSVLGDDDEDKEEDKEEDKDNDKNDKHDEDEDKKEDEGKKNDDSKEKQDEDEKDDDEKDNGHDEGEDKEEEYKKKDQKHETVETIFNDDGTVTEIKREFEDGEEEIRIETFNSLGIKTLERRYEKDDDGEKKVRVKLYDSLGDKLADMRLETESGKKLKLHVKEGDTKLSRVKYDIENQELEVNISDDIELSRNGNNKGILKIKVSGDGFKVIRSGSEALVKFPINVNDDTGQVFVNTPVGEVELKAMPDIIVEKAKAEGYFDKLDNTEIIIDEKTAHKLKYVLKGVKTEALLGAFNLNIPATLNFDAQTGALLETYQSFTTKILDLFSF